MDTPPRPPTDLTTGIEQLPSGKFRVKLRDPTRTGRWMPGGGPFDTREEAARYRLGVLAILADLADQGTLPEPHSLQRYGETWLNELEARGDSRQIATLRSQWNAHLSGTELAQRALETLTELHVRAWVDDLVKTFARVPTRGGAHVRSKRKISRDTASKVLVLLRQILESAREQGHCKTNVARGVRLKKRVTTTHDVWTWLTLDEIERVKRSDIPDPSKTIYLVGIYTGLRQGELWGLHWRDVHLDGDRPHVVVRFSRRGPPKNGKVRHVPLLAPARELLTTWKPRAPQREEGLVFPTRTGAMRARGDDARWADYHVPRIVRRDDGSKARENVLVEGYSKRLALGRHARFHDLRHTCASHLIQGSWGVQWTLSEIAAFLGHSTTEVTERYAHLSPDHLHGKAAQTTAQGTLRGTPPVFHAIPADHSKQLARPRGLEPLTSRSVVQGYTESFQALSPISGTSVEHIHACARATLEAAASGTLTETTIQALALAVLAEEPARLALELLRDNAPLRARRAVTLAMAVLNPVVALCEDADSAGSAVSTPQKP